MRGARASEELKLVPVLEPADYQAGIDGDSINMRWASHASIVLEFGAITGDAVLKVYEGATDGAKTTSKAFKYRLSSGDFKAASADLWGAVSTSVAADGVTLTAATYDHRMVAIELDAEELTDGLPFLTIELSAAADVLNLSALAVLSGLRYGAGQTVIPTA